ALDVDLCHPVLAGLEAGRRHERRHLAGLRVVERDVRDEILDHRERAQRGHGDRLVSTNVDIRVMHISRGLPLISALHEPHLPALQFQRQARSLAWVAWILWITSRTTMPSSGSTR